MFITKPQSKDVNIFFLEHPWTCKTCQEAMPTCLCYILCVWVSRGNKKILPFIHIYTPCFPISPRDAFMFHLHHYIQRLPSLLRRLQGRTKSFFPYSVLTHGFEWCMPLCGSSIKHKNYEAPCTVYIYDKTFCPSLALNVTIYLIKFRVRFSPFPQKSWSICWHRLYL